MQDTSARSVDQYFAESDEQLAQICDKYNTRKWFSISPDLGGGLLSRPVP